MAGDNEREQLSQLRLLDKEGRLARWPTKVPQRQLALRFLAAQFAPDRTYTETEVNDILKSYHAFGDWALLRRELVDRRYFDRDNAGRTYRVARRTTSSDGQDD